MPVALAQHAFRDGPHCGDQGAYWRRGGRTTLCIVDGLGHGPYAEAAAKAALDYVAQHLSEPLPEIFAGGNAALRHTRGVVMGIAVIDEETGRLSYAGIGNTRAMIVRKTEPGARGSLTPEKVVYLHSHPGIVGGGYRGLVPTTGFLRPGDRLFLFTDGLPGSLDLSNYGPSVWADGQRLAEKIIQDWGRPTDDAAVLVFSREG